MKYVTESILSNILLEHPLGIWGFLLAELWVKFWVNCPFIAPRYHPITESVTPLVTVLKHFEPVFDLIAIKNSPEAGRCS